MASEITNIKVHVSGSNPKLRLEGTETGAKDLSVRENGGVIEIYDEAAGSVVMTIESHQARHQSGGADEIETLVGLAFKTGSGDTIEIREDANNNIQFYNTTDGKAVFTIDQDTGVITTNDGTGQVDGVATTAHQARHGPGGGDALTRLGAVKRDATGAVVFATAADARGTNTTATATASLSTGLTATANFIKAKAIVGTTGTVTAGSAVTLSVLDGTAVLTSISGLAPTTLSASVPNTLVTSPNAKLGVGGMTGGTVTKETLSLLLNQLTTLGI